MSVFQTSLRIGLIRVISLTDPQARNAHGEWLSLHYPQLHIDSRSISGFPNGLYTPALEKEAVPAILQLGETLAPRVDALAVSCAADPGVAELRERFPRMPIVGAGSALSYVCRAFGRRIGFLTITPQLPTAVANSLAAVDFRVEQVPDVHKTTDLPDAKSGILAKAVELKARGCGVIGLACTGFSTLRIAPYLEDVLGIPVVDPVLAMGAVFSVLCGNGCKDRGVIDGALDVTQTDATTTCKKEGA